MTRSYGKPGPFGPEIDPAVRGCTCQRGTLSTNGPSRPYIDYADDCPVHRYVKAETERLRAEAKKLEAADLTLLVGQLAQTGYYHSSMFNNHAPRDRVTPELAVELVEDAQKILDAIKNRP